MTENEKIKEPFLKIVKRAPLPAYKSLLMYGAAVLAAIVLGGVFVACFGVNPFKFYGLLFSGCFKNELYLAGFIRIVIPLIVTSLGVAVAFKMKFWNIGAEGQFIIGAICAVSVGMACGSSVPQFFVLLLMALAAMLGAGLYGLITAVFKVRFGTNETLLTLMFNYIALYMLTYLDEVSFFRNLEAGRPTFLQLPKNAWLYEIRFSPTFAIDVSLIIAFLLVAFFFIYFRKTKHGYELTVVGDSNNTARYAGMNVKKIILRTMFLSAGVVGLAGMMQVAGDASSHTLSVSITGGVGWTAIIVAWLAKLNPIGILIASLLMGILTQGSSVVRSTLGISTAVSDILQGIILFTVLACDFFLRYRVEFGFMKRHKPADSVGAREEAVALEDTEETIALNSEQTEAPEGAKEAAR